MTSQNDAFVAFEHVQKSYDGVSLVVKDLNLNIGKGEFLTMLFKCVVGFVEPRDHGLEWHAAFVGVREGVELLLCLGSTDVELGFPFIMET